MRVIREGEGELWVSPSESHCPWCRIAQLNRGEGRASTLGSHFGLTGPVSILTSRSLIFTSLDALAWYQDPGRIVTVSIKWLAS